MLVGTAVMKPKHIKPVWAFAAVLAVFPLTGLVCALAYNSASMFYVSLAGAAIAAIVFPLVFFAARIVSGYVGALLAGLLLGIRRLSTRK